MTGRFSRFFLVGIAAAMVNITSRVLFSSFVHFEVAIVLAFLVGLTFAFSMSRLFVFEESQKSLWEQYFRFFLVNLAALAQVWLISVGLTKWLFPTIAWTFHAQLLAHAIAVGSPILTSYYSHKFFTFK